MAGSPFRIVYARADGQKFYYSREVEHSVGSIPGTKPFFSTDVREARKFHTPGEAIARRDAIRKMWPSHRFFIESTQGGDPLYEDRGSEVVPTDSTDSRKSLFIIPDDLEGSGLGWLVVPAYTAKLGKCYAVRSCDVPSLNEERPSTLETIYHQDPEWALYNARITWGAAMKPLANPWLEAQAEARLKQMVNEIQHPHQPGLRPGDRPR